MRDCCLSQSFNLKDIRSYHMKTKKDLWETRHTHFDSPVNRPLSSKMIFPASTGALVCRENDSGQ